MSDDLLQRTAAAVRRHHLFSPGQKILIAVSGGADSMVLLHLMHSLAPRNRWDISIVHFNHHLRGRASDADEAFVRHAAKKMKSRLYVGRADVKRAALRSKISIEMAARDLRHAFFARLAKRLSIRTLALAHHADDQVELFFLRLLRGAGGAGLAGMPPLARSAADPNLTLARPLLEFTKAELLAYVNSAGIAFREDASNRSCDHLRNRIRNQLLPLLTQQYQPGLNATVLRLMEIIGAESALADAAARQWRKKSRSIQMAKVGAGDSFIDLPIATQRKVVHQQLIELGATPAFELVETLCQSEGGWISLRPGLEVARDAAGKLHLRRLGPLGFRRGNLKLNLAGQGGSADFAGKLFYWSFKNSGSLGGRLTPQAFTEFFDADKVGGRIHLRHWQAGDRFQPIGMAGPVKLQDLFVNAKVPVARRRRLVLAATQSGEIFWVEGIRIADRFKLTPGTRRQLVWRWQDKISETG